MESNAYQLGSKTFDWREQYEFACLSGDHNPMHMDEVAARRTQAGRPVLHGMNVALWALDQLARQGLISAPVAECKVRFLKLMYVGETASAWVVSRDAKRVRAELRVGETPTVSVSLTSGALAPATKKTHAGSSDIGNAAEGVAKEWRLEELAGNAGRFPLSSRVAEFFPSIAREVGNTRVSFMAALSGLVGMEVPGLHSMSCSYHMRFEDGGEEATSMGFHVDEVDERFRLVTQSVYGGGVSGTVVAIARTPPVKQPAMSAVATRVTPGEFAGSTALVIGGSRGLGELAAKLVTAGGGQAVITYAVGRADAEAVRDEICAWGGACEVMPFDVRQPASEQLRCLGSAPSQLYYFATNHIFNRVDGIFSASAFADFCQFYVTGFYNVCAALISGRTEALRVLYPSSVAVVERPAGMAEYAMAKAAGEALCEDLNRGMPHMRITVARLPRLPTDQTATAALVETEDPVEVLLPLVREVQSMRSINGG
jgi:acyl dehydratase/NAD(P)-dependent dehydrogenase (short-subunit alcohol dehydrogenase family)